MSKENIKELLKKELAKSGPNHWNYEIIEKGLQSIERDIECAPVKYKYNLQKGIKNIRHSVKSMRQMKRAKAMLNRHWGWRDY